ncbi:glycoside hydrolase family 15 protein [Brevibacterium marinum]|uniref:GH15 family glucan-1,4-alpha-glucosidase n=1 Tax=Brevibacterium marinum TaxID=418643 RepID=A0A846RR53_9MICO|nr:glycoside hydrolase family 15 protein [Brevibacterium marinum]NJC56474.1 GH15 family glucan-1,4-alpha-glucosidase [Brevibacterium marinum]
MTGEAFSTVTASGERTPTDNGGFRPQVLREHALIADGERGGVIGPHGNILWMCVPRWHDEPVFATLIGGRGEYTVTPSDSWNVWGGSYRPGSLVWCQKWVTTESVIVCEDSLSYPTDVDTAVILRRIRAVSGTARVSVVLQPSSGFSGNVVSEATVDDGIWTGQVDDVRMRWQGAPDAEVAEDGRLQVEFELDEGEEHVLALELARSRLPESPIDAAEELERTYRTWQRTVAEVERPGRSEDILHSYAVLAGLTSQDNGMVAATTMSLPERPKAHRDYDYRYSGIRDQCYAGQGVARLGPNPLLDSALTFVADRINADGDDLKPAYRVDGGPVPDERSVGLSGYPGGSNVAGNWVRDQFQLDTIGEALNLFAKAAELNLMNADRWEAVTTCVSIIADRWQRPDAGVWELEDDVWTHSRLACVAGLRSIAGHTSTGEAAGWEGLADRILAEITATSIDAHGAWRQRPNHAGTDAAMLLPLVRGALPRSDPRVLATLDAVRRDLNRDGHIYRFKHGGRSLGDAEGSFTVCGFMTALAVADQGDLPSAIHFYERARSAATSSGLFTEEFDVRSRQLRGNLPQAFVHALFIETAMRLSPAFAPADPEPVSVDTEENT